ncbi:restriction endonuclease-like protein [Gallionella capsiferriformans]|uniref:DUF2357 domain-containing protein n=1 Tax=Gallionella capsiferriformans (strain ES-2) TaxID=395494 RepID=D9SGI0_GALCS|nr:restriction endonuclease-like protein [Gallionella capsiferriformans]ADL55627.1 Domain of unknown function DUF2357 [Gallionella capsiferriformans ES-2]
MPEILTLSTSHFELSVWTKEIDKAQDLLKKTHHARNADLPVTSIRFSPALLLTQPQDAQLAKSQPGLVLPEALFFENKQYTFEFIFSDAVSTRIEPVIIHRLRGIEEVFHYKPCRLSGSVNFGNDIGWFRLGVRYYVNETLIEQYLSFEVLPTKMAMAKDLEKIHSDVDALYPLWRFSLAQKTDQELAKSNKPHERFPLLWLAHFESLRSALESGVQQICRTPHTRLMPYAKNVSAERLRGRLSAKLEERVTGDLRNGEYQHRYQINAKRLSVNTPENQFVKMVLNKSILELMRFKDRVEREDKVPEQGRISVSFLNELSGWKKPLEQLLNRPFFADVGAFEGMSAESLVLQQRAGYAAVYRIWQELKLYLDLFGRHAAVSMKSVAELYEVWCLLEVRGMLLALGFVETATSRALLNNKGLEKTLTDGMGAAFHFSRADGIKIRLAHEPVFSRSKDPAFGKIYSWTTVQKPDIFLEATFANGEKIQWIFDAKYRIAEDKNGVDCAPDDAINQMHRYRDALIHIHQADDGGHEKSRPVLGAFVLYPGWFEEDAGANPYKDAIDSVGIGGFPLLPGQNNKWLQGFLTNCFGILQYENDASKELTYFIPHPDQFFAEDSGRIAQSGTSLSRYTDLTLTAPLGPDRSKVYSEHYCDGSARWYHIPLSTTNKFSVERNAMREVRYCAIAHGDADGRHITHLYPVKSVKLKNRCDLSIEQTGRMDSEKNTKYWLFELGYAQPLPTALIFPVFPHFKFRLTSAADVLTTKSWNDLPARYAQVK